MTKFILRLFAYFTLCFSILLCSLCISSIIVEGRGFTNANTESNTLFLKENTSYDIIFLGISHARNFSRYYNHYLVEETLQSTLVNLGQGKGACGVSEQLFYYKYFLKKKNSASQMVYFLSPPMLFSETLPVASNTFDEEPFSLDFLWSYMKYKSANKQGRILSYLQSKFHFDWFSLIPNTQSGEKRKLLSLDTLAVKQGQDLAYSGPGLNMQAFANATSKVQETIELAEQRSCDVYLVIPPALFGKWRGHNHVLEFARNMKKLHSNVLILDASETILDPKLYYDNHHLNTDGVEHFSRFHLMPLLALKPSMQAYAPND